MAIGKRNKDGVIIKSSGFNYYHGQSDSGLRPLPNSPRGVIKTLKVMDVVEIANNYVSVKVYPDGKIEVEPSL